MKRTYLLGCILLAACGSTDVATDLVDRAEDVIRDSITHRCGCDAELGIRTEAECRAAMDSDLATPEEINCMKQLVDDASDADIAALECELAVSEARQSCREGLTCMDFDTFGAGRQACSSARDEQREACVTSAMFPDPLDNLNDLCRP